MVESDNDKEIPITDFDKVTISNSTLMMKALIPFLSTPQQKSFSLLVRMQEMMQTVTYFNSPILQAKSMGLRSRSASIEDILKAVSCYCSPKDADMIKNLKNVMQVTNLMKNYSDMEQNSEYQNIFNMLKNMPSPDSTKYQEYMDELNHNNVLNN